MKSSKSILVRLEALWKPVAFMAGLALATSSLASAQCPTPDKLDGGPCCAPAQEKVPWFPKVVQNSLGICWRDCGIEAVLPTTARWSPLNILPATGPDCGYRLQRLDLMNGAGVVQWTGVMRLLYSRTWMETDPSGTAIQVWRFLVNGDMRASTTVGPAPCPLPPCAAAFNGRVKFSGYIDYADDCVASTPVAIAWMITHACDPIDHAPGFPRAGVFHPGRSYTFLGPGAGFVPAPMVAVEGSAAFSPFEAVRRVIHPVPGTTGSVKCEFEERFGHTLTPTTSLCLCTVGGPLSAQWNLGFLNGNGVCGTTVTTTGGPLLPGFLSMGIGTWTAPGVYPGVETLRWNTGNYDYTEACTGILRNEAFYGVSTLGGYPAVQVTSGPALPLPPIFIDQANAIRTGGGVVMNIPYISDHILNLNH